MGDELRTRVEIKSMNAIIDPKEKGRLEIIGLLICLACDSTARYLLRLEEALGKLDLKVMENEIYRTKLVEKIVSNIAEDSPAEMINREVEMLGDIHGGK